MFGVARGDDPRWRGSQEKVGGSATLEETESARDDGLYARCQTFAEER